MSNATAEALNTLEALNKHLRRRKSPDRLWLTEAYVRQVHRDMFKDVSSEAGSYRYTEDHRGVSPQTIREEIRKLCEDLVYWNSSGMPVLERAVHLHHRLTRIRPFEHGNGRLARLMADILLFSYRHPLPVWPTEITQEQYVEALQAADQGDFKPLVAFTKRYLLPEE